VEGTVKTIAFICLALALAGCSSGWGSSEIDRAPPSPAALETGDCHTWAQEREAEAGWLHLGADDVKQVSTAAYKDCQQWNASHVWSGVSRQASQ
jgi:hypothetical protein